jgi:hypothetical protein
MATDVSDGKKETGGANTAAIIGTAGVGLAAAVVGLLPCSLEAEAGV